MNNQKMWYQSKTMWLAIVQLIIAILGIIEGFLQAPELTLPAVLLAGKSLIDIWTRFKTTTPLESRII